MIIYGTKAVNLETVQSSTGICPNCKTKGELTISIFRKHIHVFWIPLFPIWKNLISTCGHCKKVMKYKEMPEALKFESQNLKDRAKGPIWQFSGVIIILLLIVVSEFGSGVYKEKKFKLFASPMKGDVYEYVVETGKYSTLKILKVSNDSIYFAPNNYTSKSIIHLFKINKEENYSDKIYSISKDKVKAMYISGEIIGVKRE